MTSTVMYRPPVEGRNSQAVRGLARRLAAYLPVTLTRRILSEDLPAPGKARWLTAATLFSDISGFTVMAEELAADGPRGAEALNRSLLMTFTAMISAIHDAGGAVCHFHGDAMLVYFPDEDGGAAGRALACARFMQSLMLTSFAHVETNRSSGQKSRFDLTMKIGVGYGRCLEMIVGNPESSLEFVLAGTAVDEAVSAEKRAKADQVVASNSILTKAGLPATGPFRIVTEVPPVPSGRPTLYWEAYEQEALVEVVKLAPAFVPPAVYERLQDSNTQFVAEHRPVTSMFVNFEGIDYESQDAGQLLQQYYEWARRIISRYGGTNSHLNRVLTGDKGSQLHILFGAPVAPDAPDQAIRCALALQREKPAFITHQKIGLAAGRVFACAVGSQNRREYTVVGGTVNLSSRLTEICADGEVLTDGATAKRILDLIEFEQLPAVTVKGIQEPVTLYRACGERVAKTQLQARFTKWQEPPIGRNEELSTLVQEMDQALNGKGSICALYGPPGSGQLQLLAAGVNHWLIENGTGFVGICQQHTLDVPFGPWRKIWRDFFELTADMDIKTQTKIFMTRARALCPSCGDDIILWGEALGLPVPQINRFSQLPAEERQARLFRLIRHYLATAATERPLLIVLEDIHWADQLSLDLIDELAQHIARYPIFIVLTFRPAIDFTFRALNRANCTNIALDDLSPERARQVIKQVLGTDHLPQIVEQRLGLRDREGRDSLINPLFLQESLKMMLSLGVLQLNGNGNGHRRLHVDETRLAQMQVPDTIYTLALARLDSLSAASRSLLQVAAVIGREFDLATLEAVTPGMSRELALELLDELQEAQMVQLVTAEPEPTYIFRRALIHDAVYQSLPYARRQSLHSAIADWLISRYSHNLKLYYPVLAYHYSQTDRHEDGLHYALAAAAEATTIFANKEAVELYKLASAHLKALGEAKYWETAAQVSVIRANVLRLLGDFSKATAEATDALELYLLYGDIAQTLPVYNMLAEIKYQQACYEDVQTLTAKVINNLAHHTSPEELSYAYLLYGMAATALFDYEGALNKLERAEKLYASAGSGKKRLPGILITKARIYCQNQKLEKALETAQDAAERVRANSDNPAQTSMVLTGLSQIQLRLGRPGAALRTIEETIERIHSASRNLLARALSWRAAVLIYLGQLPRAYVDLQEAIEILDIMDDAHGLVDAYLLAGEYYSISNDWTRAHTYLTRAGQLIASQSEQRATYIVEGVRLSLGVGHAALRNSRPNQAKSLFKRAIQIVKANDLTWWQPAVLYHMGLLKLMQAKSMQQEPREARQHFKAALRAIENGGNPDYFALILLQLANVEANKQRRLQYLAKCIRAAEKRAPYWHRITCYKVAGAVLAQCDDAHLRQVGKQCLVQVNQTKLEGKGSGSSNYLQKP